MCEPTLCLIDILRAVRNQPMTWVRRWIWRAACHMEFVILKVETASYALHLLLFKCTILDVIQLGYPHHAVKLKVSIESYWSISAVEGEGDVRHVGPAPFLGRGVLLATPQSGGGWGHFKKN